jgi:hypothetical protein
MLPVSGRLVAAPRQSGPVLEAGRRRREPSRLRAGRL